MAVQEFEFSNELDVYRDRYWLASAVAATVFHHLDIKLTEEETVAVHGAVQLAALEVLEAMEED